MVHPEIRKMIRKNRTIRSDELLDMTSEAPSWQVSSEQSTSPAKDIEKRELA